MDLTVISTYRCNSRCQMCYIWQNPTHPKEEITARNAREAAGRIRQPQCIGRRADAAAGPRRADRCRLSEGAHHRDQFERTAAGSVAADHQEVPERQGALQPRRRRSHQQRHSGRKERLCDQARGPAQAARGRRNRPRLRDGHSGRERRSVRARLRNGARRRRRARDVHAAQRVAVLQERQPFLRSREGGARSRRV